MYKWLVVLVFLVTMPGFLPDGPVSASQSCLGLGCHLAISSLRYLHGPVAAEIAGAKGCEVCHVPTDNKCTSTRGGIFHPNFQYTCTTCHDKGTGTMHTQEKVESRCIMCHNPHGSDSSPQMLRTGYESR